MHFIISKLWLRKFIDISRRNFLLWWLFVNNIIYTFNIKRLMNHVSRLQVLDQITASEICDGFIHFSSIRWTGNWSRFRKKMNLSHIPFTMCIIRSTIFFFERRFGLGIHRLFHRVFGHLGTCFFWLFLKSLKLTSYSWARSTWSYIKMMKCIWRCGYNRGSGSPKRIIARTSLLEWLLRLFFDITLHKLEVISFSVGLETKFLGMLDSRCHLF